MRVNGATWEARAKIVSLWEAFLDITHELLEILPCRKRSDGERLRFLSHWLRPSAPVRTAPSRTRYARRSEVPPVAPVACGVSPYRPAEHRVLRLHRNPVFCE